MKSLFRPFPLPLSPRQVFYLGILQGLGAGFIDGGANFAVAYAMYHGQSDVRMWVFSKNTIAGDLGVTPIIQCLASMLITSTLVHTDLHHHAISPLPYVYPHVEHLPDPRLLFSKGKEGSSTDEKEEEVEKGRKKGLRYYYWMFIRFVFEGTEKNMMLAKIPIKNWFGRLIWTIAQGAAIGVLFGFPIWCLAIIILGPIYGNGNLGNKWAPQIIKCVYGAIVGWITNPVIALLALGSQADHHLVVVEHDDPELGQSIDQGVETILEQEELQTSPSRHIAPPSPGVSLRGISNTPRMGRTRAESTSSRFSNRPPFTTNVSHLSPLPTPQMLPPSPSPNNVTRTRGNSYTIPQRPRGMTVSSYSSNRSYSYALGGTGGRAQRPRAASRATITGVPTLVLPTSRNDQADNPGNNPTAPNQSRGPEKTAAWDVFGRNEPAPSLARPVHARQRSQSAAPAVKSQDENA